MTPDDLLDDALGQVEGPRREAIDRELAADPSLSALADRLGLALHRLLDDGDSIGPPAGLAARTVGFVADRAARRAMILDFVPARVPFRWADVAVAAGVLLAGLLTLIPAVNATRARSAQMGCGFNLQQLGASLASYATRHNHYPDVCTKGEGAHVGTYAVVLKDEDFLRDLRSLHCPCRGKCPEVVANRPDPIHIDYAYNVGNRPASSGPAEPVRIPLIAATPLLADQPPHDGGGVVLPGNSPNHGARGQNVLFSDLHVEWFPTRRVQLDRDLFLNDHDRPEPGIGPLDSALIPAVFQIRPH